MITLPNIIFISQCLSSRTPFYSFSILYLTHFFPPYLTLELLIARNHFFTTCPAHGKKSRMISRYQDLVGNKPPYLGTISVSLCPFYTIFSLLTARNSLITDNLLFIRGGILLAQGIGILVKVYHEPAVFC